MYDRSASGNYLKIIKNGQKRMSHAVDYKEACRDLHEKNLQAKRIFKDEDPQQAMMEFEAKKHAQTVRTW